LSVKILTNRSPPEIPVSSFYALDYTGQDFSDIDEVGGHLLVASEPAKDYSVIIEELRSHRREIEKLHVDLANVAAAGRPANKGRP
jgi:hypothetical protein